MSKASDIRLTNASYTLETYPYQRSFAFGGQKVESAKMVKAELTVESKNGKHAIGIGAVPLGYQWAWPTHDFTPEQIESTLKLLLDSMFDLANDYPDYGHPLDISYTLSAEYEHLAKVVGRKLKPDFKVPELAVLLAASALEAAMFDAFGQLHHTSIYKLLGKNYCSHTLQEYLDAQFKDEYLDKYVLPEAASSLKLCHTIGIEDPLTTADVSAPRKDGLPEHLVDWIKGEGIKVFKVKLTADVNKDFDRLKNIDAAISSVYGDGQAAWSYCVDANEHFASVDQLLGLLEKLKHDQPRCFERIEFIEQPFSRQTWGQPEFSVKKVAALKPVIIDESLTNYDAMIIAKEQGYGGIALKTCKGMMESLLMVAASEKLGMSRAMMDLTCPGLAFLHAAAFASHVPDMKVIEGNGRQFCPNASKHLLKAHGNTFKANNGMIDTSKLQGPGLGF
jgi:L-alanine-DL-glutamate epimerase-like enolase superfamily enzyme